MLVEFFGLPGAGKSTLSSMVAAILTQRGVTTREVTHALNNQTGKLSRAVRKGGHIATYAAVQPRAVLTTIRQICRTNQRSLGDVVRICCNALFIHSVIARCKDADPVVLMDEGAAQALWSIGLHARTSGWLDLALGDEMLKHSPDMVVFVRAEEHTIKHRLARRCRKVSRMEYMLENDTLHPQFMISSAIADALHARQLAVVQVNNDSIDYLGQNAENIACEILVKRASKIAAGVCLAQTVRER